MRFAQNSVFQRVVDEMSKEQFNNYQATSFALLQYLQLNFCESCTMDDMPAVRARRPTSGNSSRSLDEAASPASSALSIDSSSSRRLDKIAIVDKQLALMSAQLKLVGKVIQPSEHHSLGLRTVSSTGAGRPFLRWERRNALGHGTFGQVYKAINLATGELMAIKEVRFNAASESDAVLQSIQEEMLVLERLQDPHVIKYFGMELQHAAVIIFMEVRIAANQRERSRAQIIFTLVIFCFFFLDYQNV